MTLVRYLAAACLLAAAGCGGATPGVPQAGPSSPSTASPAPSSPAPSSPAPSAARPEPLDLARVDPCRLLTDAQLAAFAVDHPARAGEAASDTVLAGAKDCAFGSFAAEHGFLITVSPVIGLPEYLANTRAGPSRKSIEVAGYPAVQQEGLLSAPERGSGVCFVDVDVADDQLLGVEFSQIAATTDKRLTIETVCAMAREVAEAALTTLQEG